MLTTPALADITDNMAIRRSELANSKKPTSQKGAVDRRAS
jgi:hypothetical protein